MRLPTNNLALAAVGFAAFVALAPALMLLLYAVRVWKARGRTPDPAPAAHPASERSSLRSLFEALCEVRLL